MPRLNINYENTVIYKIVCNDLNVIDCYVGSTTNFTNRKNEHKSNCNKENGNKYHLKVYKMIRDNGGWDNWTILVIEKYPCLDNIEATLRERYWYETLKATMNTLVPSRSSEEYHKVYREAICETKKKYYEANKEDIKEYSKEYYEANKEANKQSNCARSMEYYEANKDKINERRREARRLKKLS